MIEEVTTFLKWCGESFKKDEDIEDKDNPFYLAVKIIETQQKEIEELTEKNREQWAELQGTKSANKYLKELLGEEI